ncbi:5-formyltetrahydrofolate cyclo-ligase [Geobacter sp. DSM 9736]|uniref:5-formyltetrahydrofolate cyclo-ligase n=1 Tax=Geobacter sp. DSM 9736 TaxID=1277350 RepID=UPI000B5125BB|nr:5-formyltetrahydrofolate cyclo-ligase [Geobacter sp. DSM 9736]SNB46338.1 5-formyltetrahydrofolate cyclo-ligase [Geobacter sp. DSM 9736]
MPKTDIRRRMLAQRAAFPLSAIKDASRRIQRTFITCDLFIQARSIALYAPIRNEVETGEVLAAALKMGKTVLFPSVAPEGLLFRTVETVHHLCPGAYGISEPTAERGIVDPEAADIIVVPGVAFDRSGRRIGYGKGYFDRALHRLEGSGRLVGFCFDFQLVDEIAGEPHDVQMDMIITERQIVVLPRKSDL